MIGNMQTNADSIQNTRTIVGWAQSTDNGSINVVRLTGTEELIIRIETDIYIDHSFVMLIYITDANTF